MISQIGNIAIYLLYVSSVSQLFSFLGACSVMILKGVGSVAGAAVTLETERANP
jgi:hypothetical protein